MSQAFGETFDDVPKLEDSAEEERELARCRYPDRVVPDSGPIPDPHHEVRGQALFGLHGWAVEAIVDRLQRRADEEGRPPTEREVRDIAADYTNWDICYVDSRTDEDLMDVIERDVGLTLDDENPG